MINVEEIDFEGNGGNNNNVTPPVEPQPAKNDVTPLDGKEEVVDINKGNVKTEEDVINATPTEENNNIPSTGVLEQGTEVEYDGKVYKADDKGNLVDDKGQIFKQANEVDKWLKENGAVDEKEAVKELNIDNIRTNIGVDIVDETGKPVEFTNDVEGITSYINSVIELKSNEVQNAAINKLLMDNPLVKQFIDYVQINGTAKGFGDIPDRSGIVLDRTNERQLESVIRMAAQEFGNKSLNDSYIKYLKDSGALYDEAKVQLEALIGKDQAYRQDIEARAKAAREQEEKELNDYWQGVANVIAKRTIGNYKIPESFIKEVNGQKYTITPDDFYNYVANPTVNTGDGARITGYQKDLANLSDEEVLNKELLDAWMMFTHTTYKDLINMAVQEDKVKRLLIKSKEQKNTKTIKVNKPKQNASDNLNDIKWE